MGRVARALTAALLLGAFGVPGMVATGCSAAHASAGERRAGLVVELPGETKTFCIGFTAEEEARGFTGADLLERSGLEILYGGDRSAASVCRVEGVGCTDVTKCFCECPVATADSCRFWGYYTLDAKGAWVFSQLGASARRVRNGDVDGWRYANHYAKGAGAPAAASVSKLCAAGPAKVASSRSEASGTKGASGLVLAGLVGVGFVAGLVLTIRRRRGVSS